MWTEMVEEDQGAVGSTTTQGPRGQEDVHGEVNREGEGQATQGKGHATQRSSVNREKMAGARERRPELWLDAGRHFTGYQGGHR